MRIILYLGLPFLVIIASLAGLIYFAQREALAPNQLAPAAILQLPEFKGERPPARKLKVVTYNIGYASGEKNNQGNVLHPDEIEANLGEIVHTLQDLNADIICLQEVDFYSQRSFKQNQLEVLAEKLRMPYAAYVITWNKKYIAWPYWPPQQQFGTVVSGQAVLSRYPILTQDLLYFAKPADNPFWYNWFYLDRIAQRLSLKVDDHVVELWNIHLEAFDEISRHNQLEVLAKILKRERDVPLIVAGDYNTAVLSAFMQEAGLNAGTKARAEKSYPSWDPREEIDHILYHGLQLDKSGSVTGITASDHLPVWSEFTR